VQKLLARTRQTLPSEADTKAILRHIALPQVGKQDDIVHQLIEIMFELDTEKYNKLMVPEAKLVLEPKRVPRNAFIEMLDKQQFRDDVSASPFTLADFLERTSAMLCQLA
jgi:hypothetical protein